MDVGDVLLAARARLATGKWCKGFISDANGNVCARGAIFRACGWGPEIDEVERALESFIDASRYRRRREIGLIPAFNDDPDTTLVDVLALFDKVLADLGRLGEVS